MENIELLCKMHLAINYQVEDLEEFSKKNIDLYFSDFKKYLNQKTYRLHGYGLVILVLEHKQP